ncbi:MAG TPA: hypothetical protein VG225_16855 [Terracidiphilus sp.]|jgi:hypothetical protein|nr:hypothetical protein [Terracidiphilus sp.]
MRPISAADAISPAIERTRTLLFRPFSWGTYLKLGLVAILTEGVGSNLRSSTHHGPSPSGGPPILHFPPQWVAAIVALMVAGFLLAMVIFYLITRLRFAFFHCLIHNTKELRPGWHIYRDPATRFFWLNLVVGFCFLLGIAVIAIPFAAGFWRLFHNIPPGGHPDIAAMIALVLPLIPIVLLLVLAGFMADVVLRDWMLPHFALENATSGEAWSSVWASIKAEKRQFFVYALLRLILPTIALIVLFFVFLIPGLILVGSLAAVEYSIHGAFAHAAGASALIGLVLEIFFGVLAFGFGLLLGICIGGPVSTGLREFALVFYGGRYPVLGNILWSPVASPVPPLSA